MSDLLPLEDPDGHRWVRPKSAPCPKCPCCRAFVCEQKRWNEFPAPETRPVDPCPCEWAEINSQAENRRGDMKGESSDV